MASREGPNRTEERTTDSVDSLSHLLQSGMHSMMGSIGPQGTRMVMPPALWADSLCPSPTAVSVSPSA